MHVNTNNIWPQIVTFENLYKAYIKARKGKQSRNEVAEFSFDLELNILTLLDELKNLTWQPGKYRHFTLYERKPRLISAAPFRDRVVHHALMNVLEPLLDNQFISETYACRKNKGVHAAVNQYQYWAQDYAYVLKLDVQKYFPSINHNILKEQLASRIADKKALEIFNRIIDSFHGEVQGQGMAIGNLTSQFFANVYLDDLDHYVQQDLGIKKYLRYVDDMVLLSNSKNELWAAAEKIKTKLAEVHMTLHPLKIQLYRTTNKVDMFGYQVSRSRRWLRNDNGFRFRRRLVSMAKQYKKGSADFYDMSPRINSWIGHAMHGETYGLRKSIFGNVIFKRA